MENVIFDKNIQKQILSLNEIYIVSKTILYFNTDADIVNAEMMTFRSSRLLMFLKIDVLEALLKKFAG